MRLSSDFLWGARRIKRMLHKNKDFEAIITANASARFGELDKETGWWGNHLLALKILMRRIGKIRKINRYSPKLSELVYYGRTDNNMKEFRFLESIIQENNVGISRSFYMQDFRCRKANISARDSLTLVILMGLSVYHFLLARRVTSALFLQHYNFFLSYFTTSISYRRALDKLPRVAVMANDHSPSPVGFLSAMRHFQVATAYVQHAEVSDSFPSLDYTIAILRNHASLAIYRKIGQIKGDVFVAARQPKPIRNAVRNKAGGMPVVVYPTAVFDPEGLGAAMTAMQRNAAISELNVKLHPNTPSEVISRMPLEYRFIGSVRNDDHIAVVGNSSIVIELLLRGIRVFQLFGLDRIKKDYYGFEQSGLVRSLGVEELAGPFWLRDVDDRRRNDGLAQYDPHQLEDQAEVRREIAARLRGIVGASISRNTPHDTSGLREDPTAPAGQEQGAPTGKDALSATRDAEDLWAKRHPAAFEALDLLAGGGHGEDAALWAELMRIDLQFLPVSEGMAAEFLERTAKIGDRTIQKKADQIALRVFLRMGLAPAVSELVKRIGMNRLNAQTQALVARLYEVRSPPLFEAFMGSLSLSEFAKRKFFCEGVTGLRPEHGGDHRWLEEDFMRLTTSQASLQFRTLVQPCYQELRHQMKFMNVRTSEEEAASLRARIAGAINARCGFSLVRLGDGEAYLYSSPSTLFSSDDCEHRELHWWGSKLPPLIRDALVVQSLAAISSADVVGIPSVHRFFRDFSGQSVDLTKTLTNRGIITVVQGVRTSLKPDVMLSEERVHNLVCRPEDLRNYVASAPNTIVVTSLRGAVVLKALGSAANVRVIEIPSHAKTRKNPAYCDATTPLPLVLPDIQKKLEESVGPGSVVLVAAGVAGKGLIGIARQRGAVALDVGSMMDVACGIPNGRLY